MTDDTTTAGQTPDTTDDARTNNDRALPGGDLTMLLGMDGEEYATFAGGLEAQADTAEAKGNSETAETLRGIVEEVRLQVMAQTSPSADSTVARKQVFDVMEVDVETPVRMGDRCDGCGYDSLTRFVIAGSQEQAEALVTGYGPDSEEHNGFCGECLVEIIRDDRKTQLWTVA